MTQRHGHLSELFSSGLGSAESGFFRKLYLVIKGRRFSAASLQFLFCALRKAMLVLGRKVTTPSDIRSHLLEYTPGILPGTMRTFPELLRWAKHRSCIDPRDKIYGIIGLVPPPIVAGIRCDYSCSVPEVYKSAILLSYVAVTKQLDLLQHCRLDQRFENGPSWVPNWLLFLGKGRIFSPDILDVVGIYCTKVSSVKFKGAGNSRETFRAIRKWEPEGFQSRNYVGGGSLIDAFLETIYQGRTKERYPGFRLPYIRDLRQSYLEEVSKDTRNEEAKLTYVYGLDFGPMAFITAEEGYMGIGPLGVREGDYVCAILGTDLPIVLRPTPSGEFVVIGSYFIHGLMDGEALLGPVPDPWSIELCRRKDSGYSTHFVRSPSEKTLDDPRLPSLPAHWIEVNRDDGPWPIRKSSFRNIVTGEIMEFDPRMLPEVLAERGVKLRHFSTCVILPGYKHGFLITGNVFDGRLLSSRVY
ncbi:hypothetical protein DID88_004918 [Monilinia fructigena]|uniref:Uncharacterized protein n=1 Tax=Monilinia fructigena TaxID=38457 RepID=A0A395IPZ9_9HELO|nr:hypothetical protein DID88_004918 [Monilinia fructigena]